MDQAPVTTGRAPAAKNVVSLRLRPTRSKRQRFARLPQGEPVFRRKLRTALAMRGGVSLAVWIGGAVAELDVFRRIRLVRRKGRVEAFFLHSGLAERTPGDDEALFRRADEYALALVAAGVDSVEFDILAGASAGGLNGVLYSAAQRAGASFDSVLGVWESAGAIWDLLRRPHVEDVDSGLQGDDYFWPRVHGALNAFYGDRGRNDDHRAKRVSLDLSATITDGGDTPDGDSVEGYGHFHFVGSDEESADDGIPAPEFDGRRIPAESTGEEDPHLARLAYAARTTSAFPGAFEPSLVQSHPRRSEWLLETHHLDLSFAFSAHRPEGGSAFHVVDGGVKDNIPIDRALRTIQATPIDDFSTRALLYLNPRPDDPRSVLEPPRVVRAPRMPRPTPRQEPRLDPLSYFIGATITSLKKFAFRESGELEIEAVEDFRRAMLSSRSRIVGAAPPMREAEEPFPLGVSLYATDDYVLARAATDVALLDRVLRHPALWQLSTNLRERHLLVAADAAQLAAVENRIIQLYTGGLPRNGPVQRSIVSGPQALHEAVRAASAWLRHLEESSFHSREFQNRGLPADYAPRFDAVRQLIATSGVSARAARERQIVDVLRLVPASTTLAAPASVAREIVRRWTLPGPAAQLATVWNGPLTVAVDALKSLTSDLAGLEFLSAEIDHSIWARVPLADGFGARDLAPFMSGTGIPEPMSDLRIASITAGEPTAAALRFAGLRADGELSWARRLLRDSSRPIEPRPEVAPLLATDKLAGLTLFSFGGFLSAAWRRRDWAWGRLDGAAGMLRFLSQLESPARARPDLEQRGLELALDVAQAEILRTEARRHDGELDAVAAEFATAAPRLSDLAPGYLSGVLSRLLRIVSRGIGREGEKGRAARLLAVWMLRPLLVVVPVIADPARAALVVATLVATMIALIGSSTPFDLSEIPLWPGVLGGLAVIVVIGLVVGSGVIAARRNRDRWARILALEPKLPDAGSPGRLQVVAVAVLVVALVVHGVRPFLTSPEFFLVLALTVGFVAIGTRAFGQPKTTRREGTSRAIAGTLAAVGIVVLSIVLVRTATVPSPLVVAGVASAALTGFLFAGWKAGFAPRPHPKGRTHWRAFGAAAAVLGLSVANGLVVAAVVAAGSQLPADAVAATITTIVAWFAWGTTAWWLGEVPTSYAPSDEPR